MSWVIAAPDYVAAAATDLANIGSTIDSANSAASGPTTSVPAPGADEVSASIAALFDAHSQVYQAISAQAAAFHAQFVQLMNGGAAQYAATEAANASPLQTTQPGALSPNAAGQALSSAQPMVASAAASLPASAASAIGGSAHVAPVSAVAPATSVPPPALASVPPVGMTPAAAAALSPTGAPATPLQPATSTYAAAGTGAPAPPLPEATAAPVAAVPTETPEIVQAATAATPLPATPVTAAPQSAQSYRPATGPYSPGAAEEQQTPYST
ncbi:PE family protein [Mycobacterium sp. 050134]|uniref:PE family protein n=1 Tax=Mycobacterium sp. 050134 TaxID=3096111 RepID=UPI002ED7F0C7